MSDSRYTTWGSVRGDCGHAHETIVAAVKCLDYDRQCCRKLGGGAYSDRMVRAITSRNDLATYDVTKGPGEAVGVE